MALSPKDDLLWLEWRYKVEIKLDTNDCALAGKADIKQAVAISAISRRIPNKSVIGRGIKVAGGRGILDQLSILAKVDGFVQRQFG